MFRKLIGKWLKRHKHINNEKRMAWTENKRIKITLLRDQLSRQNVVVEFEINDQNRINFHKALEYFIAAVINNGGFFRDCVTVTDVEAGVDCRADIQVGGHQPKMLDILHKCIPELKSYSVRSR